jgi:hypothetical protein
MDHLADAPLIFRVAGWPVESLAGLRSPSFTAEADELLRSEAQIRVAADELSQELHGQVPKILDRTARALVLRVRRRLFGSTSALPREELAQMLGLSVLSPTLADQLVADDSLRRAVETKREKLRRQYSSVLAAERRHLFETASESRFLQALAVASPSAASQWERTRRAGAEQASQRLTATILGYLLRAVGRATPNSLWSGMCLEDTSRLSAEPLSAESTAQSVVFKPDLNIFQHALTALTNCEATRRNLSFRLNPTLQREDDVWQYLHEKDTEWLPYEASEFPQLADIQAVLSAHGAMPLSRLASMSAIGEDVLVGLAEAGILWPNIDWPAVCADPWEALMSLAGRLPEPDAGRWHKVIEALALICRDLSANWSTCEPDGLTQRLSEARSIVNALLTCYGSELVPDDRNVLIADRIAPFRIAVSAAFKRRMKEAIVDYWQFDRGGTGELLARGQRSGLNGTREGNNPDDTALPEGCWERLAIHAESEEMFRSILTAWTAELGPQHKAHRVHVTDFMRVAHDTPLPPGSALILAKFIGDRSYLRVGSVTADFCTFYARFHHLLANDNPFWCWLTNAIDGIQAIAGLPLSDVALHGAYDRNAALRPSLTSNVVDPFCDGHDPRRRVIPLLNSAVDLALADPYSSQLQRAAQWMGRPSLLRPQPPLAAELGVWRHLPGLELRDDVLIGPERWYFPDAEVPGWAELEGFERFLAWRRLVQSLDLPDLMYAHWSGHRTESLVLADSILTIELLARNLPEPPGWVRFQAVFAEPEELWLKDELGFHYVSEIAFAWSGSDAFWKTFAEHPNARKRR